MNSHLEILFQLLLACLLGGLIGLERERKSWFAGLRTHMLVCIGSTLIMIVSQYGFENTLKSGLIVLDPSRIAAQVVSGIGFLGAGTILFWKNKIKGLTTAASLWSVAAVGLAIGGNLYMASLTATVLIIIILSIIKKIENYLLKNKSIREIKLLVKPGFSLLVLGKILADLKLDLSIVDLRIEKNDMNEFINLVFESNSEIKLLELVSRIKEVSDIEKVELVQ